VEDHVSRAKRYPEEQAGSNISVEETKSAESKNAQSGETSGTCDANQENAATAKDQTLASVFFNHPLVRVAQFILLPYLIFQGLNWVSLQHPEWVEHATGGLLQFRPAVGTFEERQVLILSASVANNKRLANSLSDTLQLEIAHETFDSLHYFCRDGSVSWYQGMRFLAFARNENEKKPGREDESEMTKKRIETFKELCVDRNSSLVSQFFHPKYYVASTECSSRDTWSNCWSRECLLTVQSLWECESPENEISCIPPFRKILHATRFPLATIEDLNKTYCNFESIQSSFLGVVSGFFPHRDWSGMSSCLEAVSWYVFDFETTMLRARKQGGAIDGMFALESTSPCEVASMAGFTDPTNALYSPHLERLTKICHVTEIESDEEVDKKTEEKAYKATSKHVFVPRVPKRFQKHQITWNDLEMELKGPNSDSKGLDLIQSLKKLAEELGYTGPTHKENVEFI